jgi:RHS repeat-associated protein
VTTTSCQTVISASGRALVIGSANGLVTSVTDPMGREWTYAYTGPDLTSATDPMGNTTSYTYDTGNTDPLLAADLLTITSPDAQSGYTGPDADHGKDTVNTYNTLGQVTTQTDPMGWKTTFSYCVTASALDCMNAATGTGFVTVTDPDGNSTVYDYDLGTLIAQTDWTGTTGATLTSESDNLPDTSVTSTSSGGDTSGSLLNTASFDADGLQTSFGYDALGDVMDTTTPSGGSTPTGLETTTTSFTAAGQDDQQNCSATGEAAATCGTLSGSGLPSVTGPNPVSAGTQISPPSSEPPSGVTFVQTDSDGNQIYTTSSIYGPTGTYEYAKTSYHLFAGDSVVLPGTSSAVTCTYTPPSPSLPCVAINADGVATQLEYNAQGDLIQSSTPDGNSGGQLATTSYTYDADGEQLATVEPDGNISGAIAGNYTTTTAYNSDGEKTSVTEGNGSGYTDTPRVTSYTYDGDGNQATTKDARGYTTTSEYNADDEATLVTNADSDATLTCYDGDGNTAETVPPVGVAASNLTPANCPTTYPADYNPLNKAPLASDATMTTYNADGNQTAAYTPPPAGQSGYETTTYTYDGDGNRLSTTTPPATVGGQAQVTVDTYNNAGEVTSETTGYSTSAASTVSFCYDPNGDETSVVYADGNTGLSYINGTVTGLAACSTASPWGVSASPQSAYQTAYTYDSAGDLVSTVMPANSGSSTPTTTVTYDAAGNILTSMDPDKITTTYTYTPQNQVATISYSGSSAHPVSYTYDASGNLTGMTDATGSSANIYDSFGELTSAQNGAGQKVGYAYNADGKVTAITYPLPSAATWNDGNDTVSYGYDNADELTSVTDFNGHQITIGNTADGMPNSAALGSSGDTITTAYDNTDTPSTITLKDGSSTLQAFAYSDSPAGTILAETDTPASADSPADYSYNAHSQVTSMTPGTLTDKSYAFDASGNLTSLPNGATVSSNGYNSSGELTQAALNGVTTTYTYNADGERLGSAEGGTSLTTATWNGAQELSTYASSAANMTAATYAGSGLRASTTVTPAGGNPTTQSFVWNTQQQTPQALMDSTNAYIYDGATAPAEQVNLATGVVAYLIGDLLGSVRGAVNSSGSLIATTSYDAWGNPETTGGLTGTTPFGFAGGYTDPTGLIYLLDRYYDPTTGQFTSVDPQVSQTLQPYAYANDDPVTNFDPTGQVARAIDDGYVCPGDRFRWCDMQFEASYGPDNPEYFLYIRIQPKWHSATLRYWTGNMSRPANLTNFELQVVVTCDAAMPQRAFTCADQTHDLAAVTRGVIINQQYSGWNMRNRSVRVAARLGAACDPDSPCDPNWEWTRYGETTVAQCGNDANAERCEFAEEK